MAQDPERDDEQPDESSLNMSSELDMVPLYFSQTIEAEAEADLIKGLLEGNGIPATISGNIWPNLGFIIRVPRGRVEEAKRLIEEQQAAGPEAAAEAEAASEDKP